MSLWTLLDVWATSYRNTRACSSVVLLIAAIGVGSAIHYCDQPDAVVRTGRETGTLVEIVNRSSSYGIFMGVIELADGTQVRVPLSPPLPEDGEEVRLRVDHFESGDTQYSEEPMERDPMRY